MGLDLYTCDGCENNFVGGGDEVSCECGRMWCDGECAESDGFRHEEDGFKPANSNWEQDTSCSYCRGENFTDSELLEYVLKAMNMDRSELIIDYRNNESERV